MCTKFLSKILSYENGRGKLFSLTRGRYFLPAPVKSYLFLRSAATVASEVGHKDGVASTENKDFIIPTGKNYTLQHFLNQEEYRSLFLDPRNLNFETEGRPESVHILKNLSTCSEDEELLGKLKSSLLQEKDILNVDEICNSLFLTYQHKENSLAQEIGTLLETDLLNRKLSTDEMIKVLFVFNETWGKERISFLKRKLTYKIAFKINSLSAKQFLAFFFCNITFSKDMLKLIKFNVRTYVTNIIPTLDSVELAVIARRLLFINCTSYGYRLRQTLLQRAVELSGSINETCLISICKFLKENVTPSDALYLLEFQECLIPHLSKYSCKSLNYIVESGIDIGCVNPRLWEKVSNIYKENINDCDHNKILRMVSTLTQCDVADEELLKLGIEKFERAVEDGSIDYKGGRKTLILFLSNLIHHRIYPKKLFDVVFGEGLAFFKPDGKTGNYTKAKYWETKCFLDIDKPEFKYNSFSEEEETKLFKLCSYVLFNMRESASLYNSVYYTLNKMRRMLLDSYGDNKKVYLSTWHPAYPNGLFLRFDQNLNAQPIPDDFKSGKIYYPKKALEDDHKWVFVSLLPMVHSFGTDKVKLTALTQIRHLRAFGYEPILIHYNTFSNHVRDNTANEYLNDVINKHLHQAS